MKTKETDFNGVKKVEFLPYCDMRGELLKLYRRDIFENLVPNIEEIYITTSAKGVVRGMHYQLGKKAQDKFVYCVTGRMLDISIDLRPGGNFGKVNVEELVGGCNTALVIPGNFAHGVIILEDNTSFMSISPQPYSPGDERGVRWDTLGIDFGISEFIVSEKDKSWPSLANVIKNFK